MGRAHARNVLGVVVAGNGIVTSVVKAQQNGALIAEAARLWIRPDDTVLDVTYGQGKFWTEYRPESLLTHDLYTVDGVDFRDLPEPDSSVDVVVYDPPYVSPGGRATSTIQEMFERYGMKDAPKNPEELNKLIVAGLKEVCRVVRRCLFVKTMDYVWGGKLRLGHHLVVSEVLAAGLDQVDEFIHYSGTGPQPGGRRQVHSRRAHTFLCVFEKPPPSKRSRPRQKETLNV